MDDEDEMLDVFHRALISRLTEQGFLTHHLTTHVEDKRQKKYMGVCRVSSDHSHRRIDIISCPKEEAAPALLYFTGSPHFNRSMRLLAIKMNMSLSQHALREGTVRGVNGEILEEGIALSTPTEESIFEKLGIPYRKPEERDA